MAEINKHSTATDKRSARVHRGRGRRRVGAAAQQSCGRSTCCERCFRYGCRVRRRASCRRLIEQNEGRTGGEKNTRAVEELLTTILVRIPSRSAMRRGKATGVWSWDRRASSIGRRGGWTEAREGARQEASQRRSKRSKWRRADDKGGGREGGCWERR
jgi:hypothetical protein